MGIFYWKRALKHLAPTGHNVQSTVADSEGEDLVRDIRENWMPTSRRIQAIDTRIPSTVNDSTIYGKSVYNDC